MLSNENKSLSFRHEGLHCPNSAWGWMLCDNLLGDGGYARGGNRVVVEGEMYLVSVSVGLDGCDNATLLIVHLSALIVPYICDHHLRTVVESNSTPNRKIELELFRESIKWNKCPQKFVIALSPSFILRDSPTNIFLGLFITNIFILPYF